MSQPTRDAPTASRPRPTVLVLGAGLAGLTVARALSRHGFAVTLLEKSTHAGGKAGSREATAADGEPLPGQRYEHGYHIFAPWYVNVLPLLQELGIALEGIRRWHYKTIREGWKGLYLPSTPRQLIEVLRNSPLSVPDTLLYFYFCLDMIGKPLSQRAVLDRVTRLGLMRSRWYATETLPIIEEESILKAAAVPVHEMSAYTAKILSSYFLWTLKPSRLRLCSSAQPEPSLFMLTGDLQETMIEPYVAQVRRDGVDLRYQHEAMRVRVAPASDGGGRLTITAVEVRTPDGATQTMTADAVVVATPLDVAQRLLGVNDLIACDPPVGRINHLRTAPMAALHLTLKGSPPTLPPEHCFMMGGEYGLSFIDLSSHWQRPPYTLSFISSNFAPLLHLERPQQYERLIAEIATFLPITAADVAHWCLFPNAAPGEQLFINTVGSWTDRPRPRSTRVDNLYFAGDWVKNRVDLACMEGAVSAALLAAREVGQSFRHHPGVSVPDGPKVAGRYPPLLVRAVVILLAPFALLAYACAKLRPHRP
ncbi:MAG: FAD-dependent oxidoreductase [Candidatus Binatia bacterium]